MSGACVGTGQGSTLSSSEVFSPVDVSLTSHPSCRPATKLLPSAAGATPPSYCPEALPAGQAPGHGGGSPWTRYPRCTPVVATSGPSLEVAHSLSSVSSALSKHHRPLPDGNPRAAAMTRTSQHCQATAWSTHLAPRGCSVAGSTPWEAPACREIRQSLLHRENHTELSWTQARGRSLRRLIAGAKQLEAGEKGRP